MEAAHSERDIFAPAERVGEILRAVASALREIPFGGVHGIDIRGINATRELTAGRHLVVMGCHLTNQFGESVATFSVEAEATAEVPADSTGVDCRAATELDLQCIDNIPV